MLRSQARVVTATPERYAKQLASHFAHKVTVDELPDGGYRAFLRPQAPVDIRVGNGELVMDAIAPDLELLTVVQRVAGGHLERFGARAGLSVEWDDSENM